LRAPGARGVLRLATQHILAVAGRRRTAAVLNDHGHNQGACDTRFFRGRRGVVAARLAVVRRVVCYGGLIHGNPLRLVSLRCWLVVPSSSSSWKEPDSPERQWRDCRFLESDVICRDPDGAEASFELMVRRVLGTQPTGKYFETESYRVMVERRHNARGDLVTTAEATVKINVIGKVLMSVGEGNGPVNALDEALRKDLGKFSSYIEDLQLVDYKVRILNTEGTEATTRVLVESRDGEGKSWFTVGVSPNIVDASYQALYDSLIYKLYRDGAPPQK
jgi:2-isopropylmalate synthase